MNPYPVTILVAHPALVVVVVQLAAEMLIQQLVGCRQIVRVCQSAPGLDADRRQFIQGVTDYLRPALIEDRFTGLHVPLPGADPRAVDDVQQAALRRDVQVADA